MLACLAAVDFVFSSCLVIQMSNQNADKAVQVCYTKATDVKVGGVAQW